MNTDVNQQISAYRWVLAWATLLIMLTFFGKLALGRATIYYTLVLTLFLLLVTQYQNIALLLSPFSEQQAAAQPAAGG